MSARRRTRSSLRSVGSEECLVRGPHTLARPPPGAGGRGRLGGRLARHRAERPRPVVPGGGRERAGDRGDLCLIAHRWRVVVAGAAALGLAGTVTVGALAAQRVTNGPVAELAGARAVVRRTRWSAATRRCGPGSSAATRPYGCGSRGLRPRAGLGGPGAGAADHRRRPGGGVLAAGAGRQHGPRLGPVGAGGPGIGRGRGAPAPAGCRRTRTAGSVAAAGGAGPRRVALGGGGASGRTSGARAGAGAGRHLRHDRRAAAELPGHRTDSLDRGFRSQPDAAPGVPALRGEVVGGAGPLVAGGRAGWRGGVRRAVPDRAECVAGGGDGSGGLAALGAGGGRKGLRQLAVAVLLLVLVDPFSARSVGFALSVLASGGIIWWARPGSRPATWLPLSWPRRWRCRWRHTWRRCRWWRRSGAVSVSGLLANALAGPFVGPATVLGFAAAGLSLLSSWLAAAPGWGASWCAQAIIWIAHAGAALPGSSWQWPVTPVALVVLGAAALGVGVSVRVLARHRWWVLGACVCSWRGC